MSKVILGQDEPGHLQHLHKGLRLDWTTLYLLHTLAPVGSALANCEGTIHTISVCASPAHHPEAQIWGII